MLPEKLSTDLTSLNFNHDRSTILIEMVISADGLIQGSNVYRTVARNHAKLVSNSVAVWLEENGPTIEAVASVNGLGENL